MSEQARAEIGSIGWLDITVPEAESLCRFYSEVVGWKSEPVSMGEYDDYSMSGPSGKPAAGICHARGVNKGIPPQWLVYIVVADLERSRETCLALGGEILHGPRDLGPMGRILVIRDPAGAVAALWEEAR